MLAGRYRAAVPQYGPHWRGDNMESSSPLLQAVRTLSSTDPASSEVATTISYDQMSYILTIMITISVISILILIISVSTILVFLWYTRSLLTRKCGCSSLQNTNINFPSQHPQYCGQPLQMCLVDPGRIYRANKNVTVNPLPPLTGEPRRNLEPSIKESEAPDRSPYNSISNTDYEINQRNVVQETEPIYAEITSKKIDNSEVESKQSDLEKQPENTKGKKEIEYWQITAKEVVKFRPCTETFIVRE